MRMLMDTPLLRLIAFLPFTQDMIFKLFVQLLNYTCIRLNVEYKSLRVFRNIFFYIKSAGHMKASSRKTLNLVLFLQHLTYKL